MYIFVCCVFLMFLCVFFVFFVVCSSQAEPRKMGAIAQKLGRVLRHILCCALAGGCLAHPSLKTTCTDFGWGGVQAALGAALRSLVSPQRCTTTCFDVLSNLHADVGSRNLGHKLTCSVAVRLVCNNTHLHTHTFSLCVGCFVV